MVVHCTCAAALLRTANWFTVFSQKIRVVPGTTATLGCQPCQLNSPLNSKLTRVYNNSIYLLFTTKTKPNSNKLLSK